MLDSNFLGLLFAVAGVSTPFVIYLFRRRALRQPVIPDRMPTDEERETVRRSGRISLWSFVLFWPVALGLILAVSALEVSPLLEHVIPLVLVLMVIAMIARHLSTRCPICDYRLGYQRSLGVPKRCERCGTAL